MAFTFAHPAIALPFAKVSRKVVSLTALIIGSMVPDAEYFIRMRVSSREFHTPAGLVYFDLPFGLVLYVIFIFILRPGVLPHLPRPLRTRFTGLRADRQRPGPVHNFLVIAFSILTGAATHLLWDSFTHARGYFVRHNEWMKTEIIIPPLDLQIFLILQYGSTVLGFFLMGRAIYKLPERDISMAPSGKDFLFWPVTILLFLLVLLAKYLLNLHHHVKIEDWMISSISALLLGLTAGSIVYLLARK